MPRNSFSDIVPPERRSIRNVQMSGSRRRPSARPEREEDAPPPPPPPRAPQRQPREGGRFISVFFWVGGVVILAVVGFSLSFLFAGATVSVTPKTTTTPVEVNLTASSDKGSGGAVFQVMNVEAKGTEKVTAGAPQNVSIKASGQIVIYNNAGAETQRLIPNTRFETPEGLIFRIDKPVIVPGVTIKNGQSVPGSITATVYADEAGDKYNIGQTDFTIPGFKGSPQYEKIYARSKTAMTGGFVGKQPTITEAEKARAGKTIEDKLQSELLALAKAQTPPGYYFFPGASFAVFEDLPSITEGDTVSAQKRGVLHALIFDEATFSGAIAKETIGGYDGTAVKIKNPEGLTVTLPNEAPETEAWTKSSVEATVSGNATIEWVFDEAKFKEDLVGKAKEAMPTILTGYPAISRADVTLRPFWKRVFPEKAEDIDVRVNSGVDQ